MNESDKKYAIIQTRASENDSLKQNILIVDDHPESLHQYERRHWTQDEIRLLKTVAAQMGIVIAQANLLEQDKQQRLKLQKSESSLAAAQKITHIGSWEFDVLTNKITWSEEVFRIFGVDSTAPEPTYAEICEMYHPDDRDLFQQTVSRTKLFSI